LNSTDVIRVLGDILVQIVAGAPLRRRAVLRAQVYNRLVDHMESIREGREPVLYSARDAAPGVAEIQPSAFLSQRGGFDFTLLRRLRRKGLAAPPDRWFAAVVLAR